MFQKSCAIFNKKCCVFAAVMTKRPVPPFFGIPVKYLRIISDTILYPFRTLFQKNQDNVLDLLWKLRCVKKFARKIKIFANIFYF